MAPYLGLRGNSLTLAQIMLIICPAYTLYGYQQSGLGGLVSLPDWVEHFPQIDTVRTKGHTKSHNSTLQGLVIATFVLGAIPGCLSCSWSADRFGRRAVIFFAALLGLIGTAIEASAFALPQLIVGRLILGFGVGMLSTAVPMWQTECSSSKNRGKHVVLVGMFLCLGYTFESWIDLGFYHFKPNPISWRVPIAISAIFPLTVMTFLPFMPESPRWLIRQSRISDAKRTLSALRDVPEDDPSLLAEVAAIEQTLERAAQGNVSLVNLLRNGEDRLLYRFLICILLQFYQQMSGGSLISIYSTIIFTSGLGMDGYTARILSGAVLTWKFLACFVSFFAIDRLGRRVCFMISGTGMACCMLGLAVATSFPHSDFAAQIISTLFVFLFNLFLPIGFLGANFLYAAEIAPTHLRAAMTSISISNHWVW